MRDCEQLARECHADIPSRFGPKGVQLVVAYEEMAKSLDRWADVQEGILKDEKVVEFMASQGGKGEGGKAGSQGGEEGGT